MYLGGSGTPTITTVATGGVVAAPFAGTGALLVVALAAAFAITGFLLLCQVKRRARALAA